MSDEILHCLRCQEPLRFLGERDFHEGTRAWGFVLGDLGELLTSRERIAVYACESCGHMEFFLPES